MAPDSTGHQRDSPRAWLTVVAAFLSSAVTLGIAYSFGAFFESMSEEFGADRSATAVIFGITTFTFFFAQHHHRARARSLGAASDPRRRCDGAVAWACWRRVGSTRWRPGTSRTALASAMPPRVDTCRWSRSSADGSTTSGRSPSGFAVAGIGVGTLVLSPLAAALIDRHGWRDTYVAYAIGGALILLLCIPLVDRPPGRAGPQPSRFRRRDRVARLPAAPPLGVRARSQPVRAVRVHRPVRQGPRRRFGRSGGAGRDPRRIQRARAGSASVRSSAASDRSASTAAASRSTRPASCGGPSPARRYALMVVFVLVLGIGYGGFVALGPIVISDHLGVTGLGSILGIFYTAPGLGGLIGPPTAGG